MDEERFRDLEREVGDQRTEHSRRGRQGLGDESSQNSFSDDYYVYHSRPRILYYWCVEFPFERAYPDRGVFSLYAVPAGGKEVVDKKCLERK